MNKRIIGIFICIFFFLSALSHGQQEKTLSLSLEECILKAMENNLGLAVEVLSPELADISISLAKEKFMPSLSFSYGIDSNVSPSYSFLDAADEITTDRSDYSAQITQLFPTGGNLSINLTGYATESNRSFQTINPRYGGTLRFNFTQPILNSPYEYPSRHWELDDTGQPTQRIWSTVGARS